MTEFEILRRTLIGIEIELGIAVFLLGCIWITMLIVADRRSGR
jgi:hypothetical protein